MNAITHAIKPFGEHGFIATLTGGGMVDMALAANAAADALRAGQGVIDAVAGIDSLVIRFDPAKLKPEDAARLLGAALNEPQRPQRAPSTKIEIPVCYGGAHGPDFDALCRRLSMSATDLIDLHAGAHYRVLAVGFAPGFAYLGPLPEGLHTERLDVPRARVPAGAVGIAGGMTGVYPLETPGGWPLIGRTPAKLFDLAQENLFRFAAGAEVRFTPIDASQFDRLASAAR